MNREQRRVDRKANIQGTKKALVGKRTKSRSITLWAVGLLIIVCVAFSLVKLGSASGAAKEQNLSKISPVASSSFPATPKFSIPALATVSQNSTSHLPVWEAHLKIDLSETNDGHPFNLGRIAPCSNLAVLADGKITTVGELKVGDRIRMSGGNIGRVQSTEKNWYTPAPLTYNNNGVVRNRVIATTKRMADRVLYLYTSAELIKTTPEHPFAIQGKGYVAAGKLQKGDLLETRDAKGVVVERTEIHDEPQFVYNMEVENAHNFYVGKNAVLVHNGGSCVPAFAMHTIGIDDLTTAGMRNGAIKLTGQSGGYLVYVIRDTKTGEFLKVGQTGNYRTRFGSYRTRALKEGRRIEIDVFEVDKSTARGMTPTLESQMQKGLMDQGHNLPWDKSKIVRLAR